MLTFGHNDYRISMTFRAWHGGFVERLSVLSLEEEVLVELPTL